MITYNITSNNIFKQLKLKEHSLYLIKVKITQTNPTHKAILFTGFKTGSYCTIYNNSYEYPVNINKVYFIEIIKQLN